MTETRQVASEPANGEVDRNRDSDGQSDTRDGVALARDSLRTAILSGELPAGLVISQVDLAKRLEVGRTPLREALRILEEEGLVLSQARRIRIAEFSIQDLEEVYVLRLLLETAAVRITVPKMSPEEIAELWGLLAQMSHYSAQGDYSRLEIPHRKFHGMLVAESGPRLVRQIEQLYDHAGRYRRAYVEIGESPVKASTEEHNELYAAVEQGDAAEAARRLASHYFRIANSVIEKLDPSCSPSRLVAARAMAEQHAADFPC